jgi:uracil-DNA glycosylase
MPTPFDPGYGQEPFRTLVTDVPDATVFPLKDFRVEWGPVFHRGRLDGTARLLVIGQDPAQHEVIARRTLVGGAGHRLQGFLAKLGLTRSYVMVNTYVYSVFGQGGGNRHKKNAAIAAYRNRWFDALLPGSIQGVVALGQLADAAWQTWRATPNGAGFNGVYTAVTHPTQPEGSSKGDKAKREAATKKMLEGWNAALGLLQPAITPDVPTPLVLYPTPLVLYGDKFLPSELPDIPQEDFPAGSPPWMCGNADWAKRTGTDDALKRVTITVTIPKAFRPA